MDPLAASSKDAGTQTTRTTPSTPAYNNPLMPPAKQQRILIWRTEVASALSLPTSSHSSDSAISAASPGPDEIDNAHPAADPMSPMSPTSSKARGFWKRISWRFSRRRDSSDLGPDAQRTSMYRADRPSAVTGDETQDDNDGFPDKISDDGARNGLREKQERLSRAARLLNKGIGEDEGAAVIKAQRSGNGQNVVG